MRLLHRRGVVVLVVIAISSLLFAGCTAVTSLINTDQALRDAGYQSVSVNFNMGSGDEVDASVKVSAQATDSDAQDVARIVWHHFHERFQWLHVTVGGTGGTRVFRVYAHQDLVALFGARNPAWDRTTVSTATMRFGVVVIAVVGLVVLAIVLVIVLTRRRRRGGPGGGYPGGGYPAGAYPAGAYPGGQGGRWQPGVGWQPGAGQQPGVGQQPPPAQGEWRPAAPGVWQPSPGSGWQPNPLWPAPQGPPPPRGEQPPAPAHPPGPPPGRPRGEGSGWGSPPEER